MKVDTRNLEAGAVIETDVCIVGAGAAGITIAHQLRGTALDVCLLEGGGLEHSKRSQDLYEGEMATIYREGSKRAGFDRLYVGRSRLRFFGGTTNHWNGWCRPLEPLDFEARDWVPNSGWPISRTDLDPWYDKARAYVEIPAFEEDHGYGRHEGRRMVVLAQSPKIVTRLFHWSPPTRFGQVYREDVLAARNVRLFLESNVVRFAADADGRRVDHVDVQVEDGPAIKIRAKAFVLSCGGIENPRLLLNSDDVQRSGLGNDNDVVGRYFLEHPHVRSVGQVLVLDHQGIRGLTDLYFSARKDRRAGGRSMGVFVTSPEVQREERLLNFSVQMRDRKKEELSRFGRSVKEALTGIRDLGRFPVRPKEPYTGRLFARAEQVPNPDSRVTLTDQTDRLGLRRVRLDWQLTEQDCRSMRRSMEILAQEFSGSGIGRMRIRMDSPTEWPPTRGGDHHMGTTRMSDDPKKGVVDRDCRVHGLANLFVGGSSVFATCGFCNPTFTITALAVRLADHLRTKMTR